LFRMDRVLIDGGLATVVDFKTGGEEPAAHSAQMSNYLSIISGVYRRPVEGLLAYVDLDKLVRVEAVPGSVRESHEA
ncbi:MAG TPA: hypothetical protein PL037_01250, partial [Elusimicrobiales bacterium]|nr:hypothetical protein [Elusimicrobiales bacterium]